MLQPGVPCFVFASSVFSNDHVKSPYKWAIIYYTSATNSYNSFFFSRPAGTSLGEWELSHNPVS